MDVTEILKSATQPPEKRSRIGTISTANATPQEILAALEQESSFQALEIDEASVKKICMQLERKQLKNREMRIKYVDEPQKFMDSELELNNAIQEMHAIAAQPDLYAVLIECGSVQTLAQLLAHENTDIVAAVLNLIQELSDVEILHESQEGAEALVNELFKCQIIETLVQQALGRMNEGVQDEADAVQNALTIVENLLDFRPGASDLCVEQGLLHWLLIRATKKGSFDGNKLFASQLLHILLQSSELAREKLVGLKTDGVDKLLRGLNAYKRRDPDNLDENEHMENLFNSLCSALLYAPNKQTFLDGEGLQLMNLMLKEKKRSREGALKVLSYAISIPDGGANANKFVEIGGLGTLFPLFMRTPPKVKRKDTTPDDHEEYCCSIIDTLLFLCTDANRQRVLHKFSDHGCEKVDRTIELFEKYNERVKKFTARLERSEIELDADELYIEKQNNGLYVLERAAIILAEVCIFGALACRERAAKVLRLKHKNPSVANFLEKTLREFHSNLDPEADSQKQRIEGFLVKLAEISQKAEQQNGGNNGGGGGMFRHPPDPL